MATDLLQLAIYGVVSGSILTLGAIGVSLIYGILRFAHFAHGDLMAVGAYFAFSLVAGLGFPLWASAPFAVAGTALVAVAIDQTVYRRLRRVSPIILLISSFGIAIALRSVVQLIWGPHNQVYASGIQLPWRVGDIVIKPDHVWIVLGAIVLVTALHLFLTRTKMGKAMRAMSDNMDLALVSGIPSERVIVVTWAVGGGMAAVAGIFLGMDTRLHPVMGWSLLLPVFAAAILGGIGRPYGAIAGGMVIGLAMEMSTVVIDPTYKPAVAFALMVLMLIVRPQGLFKGNP
ncbi:branched-chain amino acid ABC transporter permease [Rhodospira trueperi]|uniref:Branched-chain amino acid transport system permease protein/neutral amino acid transport system permease protein n=1 Tax=Rhodospira trueperi TaxID=69960 RepID=A0A1G6WT11_9PROT|nr:branched-chain amino acid ABC transporter permease [Rhodospira trueperi]SDD68919.1 branched-chain amino acid transport system permease protein/neutral amino acid transport system permease protein [Rhodospira trueperi]